MSTHLRIYASTHLRIYASTHILRRSRRPVKAPLRFLAHLFQVVNTASSGRTRDTFAHSPGTAGPRRRVDGQVSGTRLLPFHRMAARSHLADEHYVQERCQPPHQSRVLRKRSFNPAQELAPILFVIARLLPLLVEVRDEEGPPSPA